MRQSTGLTRRVKALPIIPKPEADELLSSWITRTAAIYGAKPSSLLEQIGCLETCPSIMDRRPETIDMELLALSMRRSPADISEMTFVGIASNALEFVSHKAPGLRCYKCCVEFSARGLRGIVMRRWHVTVATNCRRCGDFLRPARHRVANCFNDVIRDEEFRSIHIHVCRAIENGADDELTMAAVVRGMRALAARIPTNKKRRTAARRRGQLPDSVKRPLPLLWQMVDMARFREKVPEYARWEPPTGRAFAAWPPIGQIASILGLNVLAQCPPIWDFLQDVNLVEGSDVVQVRKLLGSS